jgi:hypothetical protein
MKFSRLVGLIVGAALAMNLVAVTAASASDPEFLGSLKQTFKTLGGTAVISTAEQSVACSHDSTTGEVQGATRLGKLVVTFTGCVAEEGGRRCTIKTDGGSTGVVVTNPLVAELGLAAKAEAASGVGLLLLPETTKVFVKLQARCFSPELFSVEGQIAPEVSPIGVLSTTGKIAFNGGAGNQSIKEIGVLGATVKPRMSSFGVAATSGEGAEELVVNGRIEVM